MSNLRDQQQQAANQNTADAEAINNALKNVHTFVPGIIHSFDPDTQTAQVQPAIKRIFVESGAVNLPLCVDVIVHFPKTGGFCMTWPVQPGDECLLGFFERAIDRWFASGGVQDPSEYRLHDLSDGFAIVGISSKPNMITGFNPAAPEIRTLDGSTIFRILQGGQLEMVGDLHVTGDITATGTMTAPNVVGTTNVTFGGKSGIGHTHGENDAGGQTDPPT